MKSRKRFVATLICSILVITLMSACTSTGGSTTGSNEETRPTVTEKEPETTEPTVTEEPETTEPTVTEEPETTEPAEPEKDVLIPLSMQMCALDGDWKVNFSPDMYDMYFNVQKIEIDQLPSSEEEIRSPGELAELVDVDTRNLELSDYSDREVRYPCAMFFDKHVYGYAEGNFLCIQVLVDGRWQAVLDFVPLFYNETKGIIVGIDIANYTVGEVKFSELTYSQKLVDTVVSEISEDESQQYFDAYFGD